MHKEGGARATKRKNVNCTRKGKEGTREKTRKERTKCTRWRGQRVTFLTWRRGPNRVEISEEKLHENLGPSRKRYVEPTKSKQPPGVPCNREPSNCGYLFKTFLPSRKETGRVIETSLALPKIARWSIVLYVSVFTVTDGPYFFPAVWTATKNETKDNRVEIHIGGLRGQVYNTSEHKRFG